MLATTTVTLKLRLPEYLYLLSNTFHVDDLKVKPYVERVEALLLPPRSCCFRDINAENRRQFGWQRTSRIRKINSDVSFNYCNLRATSPLMTLYFKLCSSKT